MKKHISYSLIFLYGILTCFCTIAFLYYMRDTFGHPWGVDYLVLSNALSRISFEAGDRAGSLYHEHGGFYNFPLTLILIAPYSSLPFKIAVAVKTIVTIGLTLFNAVLLARITGKRLREDPVLSIGLLFFLCSFFLQQFYYQNCYIEVLTILLLSLYFYKTNHIILSAFCLSLAALIKLFLFPLFLCPLLIKERRLFGYSVLFCGLLILLSIAVLGIDAHIELLTAVTEGYTAFRRHCVTYPYVSDFFAGFFDLFNKLHGAGQACSLKISIFTGIAAVIYAGCAFFTFYKLKRSALMGLELADQYSFFFGVILIYAVGFNLRYDHGTLLFAALPMVVIVQNQWARFLLAASLSIIMVLRYGVVCLLKSVGAVTAASSALNHFFSIFSFQFVGMIFLVGCVTFFFSASCLENKLFNRSGRLP